MGERSDMPPVSLGEMVMITTTVATSYLWLLGESEKKASHRETILGLWNYLIDGRAEPLFHMFNVIEKLMRDSINDNTMQSFLPLLSKARCAISAKTLGIFDYVLSEHDALLEGYTESKFDTEGLSFKCSWQGIFTAAGGLVLEMLSKQSNGTLDEGVYNAVFGKVAASILNDGKLMDVFFKTLKRLPYRDSKTGEPVRELNSRDDLEDIIEVFAKTVPLIIVEIEENERTLNGAVDQLKTLISNLVGLQDDTPEYLS